jgi:hypothetical protein
MEWWAEAFEVLRRRRKTYFELRRDTMFVFRKGDEDSMDLILPRKAHIFDRNL